MILRKSSFVYTGFLIFFSLVVIQISMVIAETLPPLPIKDLLKVDLHYNDTIIKPVRLDTFRLKLFGGNVMGGDILLNQSIGKKTLLRLNAVGGNNFDYSNYLWEKSGVLLGYLSGDFWQELSLLTMWKKRAQRYYDYYKLSYAPVLFIANGTITLNGGLRKAQYFDYAPNNFLSLYSDLNYNTSSRIGIVNTNIDIISQVKDMEKPLTNASVGLKDLIIIGDNLFINPGIDYDITQKRLSIKTNLGFFIAGLTTCLDLNYNTVERFYLDSLYTDVFPYLVNEDLDYPIYQWKFGLSVQWRDFKLTGYYQEYSSFFDWTQQDSWIKPELVDSLHTQIGFSLSGKWRFLENCLGVNYIPNPRNLTPNYLISDSILIKLSNWEFISGLSIIGKRVWYDQTLPKNILVMSQLGYQWRFLKLFTRIDNLLDNKYEILPNHFDKGIKYSLGLELLK
jgi:hypothetical protein